MQGEVKAGFTVVHINIDDSNFPTALKHNVCVSKCLCIHVIRWKKRKPSVLMAQWLANQIDKYRWS